MNLATTLSLIPKIEAGGPGSGRHPGGGFNSKPFDVRPFKSGAQAYAAGHAHVLDQLNRLKAMLEANPPTGKEHWGHAGSMSHVSEGLADVHNSMAGTGEYSDGGGWLGK